MEPWIWFMDVVPSIIHAAAPCLCWYELSDTASACLAWMSAQIWIIICICQSVPVGDHCNCSCYISVTVVGLVSTSAIPVRTIPWVLLLLVGLLCWKCLVQVCLGTCPYWCKPVHCGSTVLPLVRSKMTLSVRDIVCTTFIGVPVGSIIVLVKGSAVMPIDTSASLWVLVLVFLSM